ncbi:MAG: hypothetical protein ACQEXE_25185 [Bacillota bacterium]|jgi:hypothetical protein|uniref:hypothetical protein n=1 Tax=Bacillaceae TaxID=186817 RepID=UPI000302FDF2|nr:MULTISPECIES: hypothetical protein [Bacillaceae]MBN8202695.1 hypothetical protein [Bacillus sp. NTK034]MCM3244738.1 hypothetical protein [Cytobacillus oceanisediminis]USK47416.1 hypothetical protein LIT27_30055 [Cytobacillus oceanisediminis]
MDYYNYELIIKTKQQETNEESFFRKLVTKFSSVKKASEPSKQNQCVCICEC